MNWKEGDRALIVNHDNTVFTVPKLLGATCTLCSYVGDFPLPEGVVYSAWSVELDEAIHGHAFAVVGEPFLRPLFGDDDASWEKIKESVGWSPEYAALHS